MEIGLIDSGIVGLTIIKKYIEKHYYGDIICLDDYLFDEVK
jgi:glutamate racemase